jgi:hypothetical protein
MPAVETDAKPAVKKKVTDAQTGKEFDVIHEGPIDIGFAWISAAYSLAVIGLLTWLILNVRSGQPTFPSLAQILSGTTSKLIFYTAIGGAIGAAVNNLRSFIAWHAEEQAFGWRFIWKYLAMPPIGGTLAVLVYGILQGGAAVVTGANAPTENQITTLSAWATGALAGYGSHNVFKWLDDKVNSLFKIAAQQTTIPDVKGQLLEEARQALKDAQLKVGDITEAPASSDQVGKVIAQTPEAGIKVDCSSKVDLTVGIAGPTDPAPNPAEGTIPHNGQPIADETAAPDAETAETSHG